MDSDDSDSQSSSSGHLGTAWEIGVVVAFVVIISAIVATAIFQYRRRQRRRQFEYENDVEQQRIRANSRRSSATLSEAQLKFESGDAGVRITKPPPTASSKRTSRGYILEHLSQKPPKYYWDRR